MGCVVGRIIYIFSFFLKIFFGILGRVCCFVYIVFYRVVGIVECILSFVLYMNKNYILVSINGGWISKFLILFCNVSSLF